MNHLLSYIYIHDNRRLNVKPEFGASLDDGNSTDAVKVRMN